MSNRRISAIAIRQLEKESTPVAGGCKPHGFTKPRQTWTASASAATRTPHRICKDIALARLLTPAYLSSSSDQEKTPVLKRCSTLPRPSQRTLRKTTLRTPLRRLRSLSIHTSAEIAVNRNDATRGNSDVIGGNYGTPARTNASGTSSEDVSTTESEISFSSDESSDTASVEWVRQRRRRPGVKCIATFTPATTRTALRSTTCSSPRTSNRPVGRLSVCGSSVPPRIRGTPARTELISDRGLPGRENEFDTIYTFVSERLSQQSGGCMYISGLPGTGKTASVNAVLSAMSKGKHAVFQKVMVSGMQVSDPRQVYTQIYQQLTGKILSAKQAADKLDYEFSSHSVRRMNRVGKASSTPVVLVIDELDLLCTRRQDVLYRLFDWPTRPPAHRFLIVLTIANTMDLPDRLLHPRVASRLGMARLTFAPYTHEQLIHIIRSRLIDTTQHTFQDQAVELAARKVAAVSGDVRRALDICRRAAEMVSHRKSSHQIGIEHINAALKEMFTSPKVSAIRSCSVYEKLFLRALVAELQTRNVEEARLDRCILQMCALCRLEGFVCPTTSEVFGICSGLGAYKLLLTEDSRRDLSMLIRLNCSRSDVLFALKPPVGA